LSRAIQTDLTRFGRPLDPDSQSIDVLNVTTASGVAGKTDLELARSLSGSAGVERAGFGPLSAKEKW
jgi:hypothetical protein